MAVVATGAMLATGATLSTSANAKSAEPKGLDRFYQQTLKWGSCQASPDDEEGRALDEAGAQCAKVTVPLDYSRPGGRTISLAVSRLKATDTAHRIGPLFFNLGGPGNPVLASVAQAPQAMGETAARFDVIGMDPRFAGRSTPMDCRWPRGWLPSSAGADRESFNRMVRTVRDLARRCVARHGDLLPYASTADIARDMDVVRAALRAPKLSYVGYSQGSYLGAVYTQLFPRRADRMVLDSAIDPNRVGARVLSGNTAVREAALRGWAGWAARRDDEFHLGRTAAAVSAAIHRAYRTSAQRPLRVGPYKVDDTVFAALLTDPLTDDSDNAELASTVRVLVQAAGGAHPAPTESMRGALEGMLTGADSALDSPQTAILCADAAVPRDPERYWRDIQAHRLAEPLFGPVGRAVTPCAFWPAPRRPAVEIHNGRPALIVNAAGDVNATLPMGRAMHRALTGSHMITLDGARTHGVYLFRGASCVDDTVNAYLRTGRLPARDLHCSE